MMQTQDYFHFLFSILYIQCIETVLNSKNTNREALTEISVLNSYYLQKHSLHKISLYYMVLSLCEPKVIKEKFGPILNKPKLQATIYKFKDYSKFWKSFIPCPLNPFFLKISISYYQSSLFQKQGFWNYKRTLSLM